MIVASLLSLRKIGTRSQGIALRIRKHFVNSTKTTWFSKLLLLKRPIKNFSVANADKNAFEPSTLPEKFVKILNFYSLRVDLLVRENSAPSTLTYLWLKESFLTGDESTRFAQAISVHFTSNQEIARSGKTGFLLIIFSPSPPTLTSVFRKLREDQISTFSRFASQIQDEEKGPKL